MSYFGDTWGIVSDNSSPLCQYFAPGFMSKSTPLHKILIPDCLCLSHPSKETKLTKSDIASCTTFTIMEEKASAFNSSKSLDVECSACTGWKRKAEQTCLECLSSYCDFHLDLHNTLHVGKRHRLVEAIEELQGKICPHHDKLQEVYCRTDQQCICHLCITDNHRGHDVIAIEMEVMNKQVRKCDVKYRCTV